MSPTTRGGLLRPVLKRPKVRRALGAAFFLLAADLVLALSFWGPAALERRDLRGSIDALHETRRESREAARAAREFKELDRRVADLETRLAVPASQSGLVRSLTQSASRHGLRVLSQDLDLSDATGGAKVFRQNLSLAGSYAALRAFLLDLEGVAHLTVVEDLEIESGGKDSGVRAALRLSTYHRPLGVEP